MTRFTPPFTWLVLSAALLISDRAHAAKIVLVAGGSNAADGVPATEALLKEPFGTDFDRHGNAFIIEMMSGNRLLKIDSTGKLTHIAGTGKAGNSGDGGPALQAEFHGPHNLAVLPDGNVLIGDTWNGRVRKVDVTTGKVSGVPGFEALGEKAKGSGPYCITLDFTGTKLYVADLRRIHVVDLKTGTTKVIAGNGQKGKPQDGAVAIDAPLSDPRAVAPDRKGNIYILERGGNALRVVDAQGKIRTVVNASGKVGGTGDGGPALAATMSGPKHLCVDLDDNVIIADAESHLVRKYLPKEGKIVRVAGTGKKGSAGVGGDPAQCGLSRPHGVVVHPQTGELYITDSYNNRVLKIVNSPHGMARPSGPKFAGTPQIEHGEFKVGIVNSDDQVIRYSVRREVNCLGKWTELFAVQDNVPIPNLRINVLPIPATIIAEPKLAPGETNIFTCKVPRHISSPSGATQWRLCLQWSYSTKLRWEESQPQTFPPSTGQPELIDFPRYTNYLSAIAF